MNLERPPAAVVRLRDRSYTIAEALALALRELSAGNAAAAGSIYDHILAAAPDHAEALLNRGNALLAQRRPDEALASFDRLLELRPDCGPAHNGRGIVLQELKRPADALASFDRAVAAEPHNAQAHSNRGLALRDLNRLDEALASFDRALAAQPANALTFNNRGLALRALKRHAEALAAFDKAVALQPGYAAAHNNRGTTLQALNRPDEALASFDRAATLQPGNPAIYNNGGLALKELRQYPAALACFDRAVALRPDYAEAYTNRGLTLLDVKRLDDALASCDRAVALRPDYPEAHSARGTVLLELKRYDDALASCDAAIALDRGCAIAYETRGVVLADKGDMATAEEMFRTAADLRPDNPLPLFKLTTVRKYRDPAHEDVRRIQAALAAADGTVRDRDSLYFALGKVYDDCGRFDEAFDAFRKGNDLRNAAAGYDAAKTARWTDAIIGVFTRDFLDRHAALGSASRSPVFVVGMPRSGTTLVASVLSNHRDVATAGELPALAEAAHRLPALLGTDVPYPEAAGRLTPAVAARLAADYEARLRRDVGPGVPFVVDKNPVNFRHVGLIALLFPRARIVHCRRHPLDTGLSNFFQYFSLLYDFAFDLGNIGHFTGEYARLMAHWRAVLPGRLVEVPYEELVADTERVARATLDRLGLDWDERCLAPHTNPSAVETASNWQVRQPIYKQSMQRWRHYERHLGPLKAALARAGVPY